MASTVTKKNKSMQQSKHCVANQKLCTLGPTVNQNGTVVFLMFLGLSPSEWERPSMNPHLLELNVQFSLLLWWCWATPIVSFRDVIPREMIKYFFKRKSLKTDYRCKLLAWSFLWMLVLFYFISPSLEPPPVLACRGLSGPTLDAVCRQLLCLASSMVGRGVSSNTDCVFSRCVLFVARERQGTRNVVPFKKTKTKHTHTKSTTDKMARLRNWIARLEVFEVTHCISSRMFHSYRRSSSPGLFN